MKKLLIILLCLPFIGFGQVTGCMDSLACNYDSLATFNNGNCIYSAMAPYNEDFSSGLLPQGDSCSWLQNAVIGDGWRFDGLPGYAASFNGRDTGSYAWIDFSSQDSSVILEIESIDITNLTLPALFFDFYSYVDTFGNSPPLNILNIETWDGTSWIWQGSFQLNNPAWTTQFKYLNNTTYINNLVKIRFRAESSVGADYFNDLLIDNVKVQEFLLGCTDSLACNYNALATIEDSSCLFSSLGIANISMSNYLGYNISCLGCNDGWVSINMLGGVPPYHFLWSNGSTSDSIYNLYAGSYSVIITDGIGCISEYYIVLNETPLSIQEHTTKKELLKVTDLLGRETKQTNQPLFYIYDDGTVEKKTTIK